MAIKTTEKTTVKKLSTASAKKLKEEVFDPLSKLIDLEIKKGVRKPLTRAMINYVDLNNQQIEVFNNLVAKAEKDIKELKENLVATRQSSGRAPPTKKDFTRLELDFLRETFGVPNKDGIITFKDDKGKEISLVQIKKLTSIAKGLDPGNFDRINIIGRVIGLDYREWDKGHESASIISLKIASILRSPALDSMDPAIKRDLQKLLDISRRIDHVDDSVLEPFAKNSTNSGYEIIGSILNSDLTNLELEADVAKQIVEDLASGTVSVKLTVKFEAKHLNKLKSIAQGTVGKLLKQILESRALEKESRNILDKVDAANIKGSPTTTQVTENILLGAITGKYKKLRKPKGHKLGAFNNRKVNNPKPRKSKIKPIKTKPVMNKLKGAVRYDPVSIDTFSIRALINQMLSAQMEKQMADSAATDGRLRYQSGRFADSVNLLSLTRAQNGILAGTYTYQRSPYDVFLPGGKMATPKRDPRIYVEGAIRESALIILKNKFPGIALELK